MITRRDPIFDRIFAAGENRLRDVNQEMNVIVHQAVSVTTPPEARHHPGQGGQEHLADLIVAK